MKKTLKRVVLVLCVALLAFGLVLSCGTSGGGGGRSRTPVGTSYAATGEWGVFMDNENGGSSTSSMTTAQETINGEAVTTYATTGTITNQYQYGFAGWLIEPDEETLARIKKATGLSFWVQGDGGKYEFKFKTKECESDYCYYSYIFTAPAEPTLIEVPVNRFMQPSWGQYKPFRQESFTGLEWQTSDLWQKSPAQFSAKVWDLKIFNE